MKHLIITITLLISSVLYAQSNNVAAVSWVLYDNRDDFKKRPELIEKFLCNEKSTFKVCKNNLFEVDKDAPLHINNENSNTSFEGILVKALDILNDENATLIIAISSHGNKGVIGRQDLPYIYHKEFVELLFSKIDERQKNKNIQIHLILFYSACHSNSILDYIKQSAQDNTGKYFDGGEKYKYKIDLYTSASADKVAFANIFWKVLLDVTQSNKELLECNKEYCLTNKELINYYLKDTDNSHCLWSSYKDTLDIGTPEAIPYLCEALKDKNPFVKKQAADAFREIDTPEAIPYLGEALKDKDTNIVVKEAVAQALGKIGTSEAIFYLGETLEDPSVKRYAIEAFGVIGTSEVIPYLKEALLEDNVADVSLEAALAFSKIGTSKVISYLGKVLKDKDTNIVVKKAVAQALGKIGTPEAVSYLGKVLKDKDTNTVVKKAVTQALGKIGTPEVIPCLGKALLEDNDPKVKEEAARALLIIVTPDTPEAIPYLGEALKDDNLSVKRYAISALLKIGTPEVVPYLITALDDNHPFVRRESAIYTLGQIGTSEAISCLCKALENKDNDKEVRRLAARALALGKIDNKPEVIPYLGKALLEDNYHRVKIWTADALGKVGTPEVIPYLKEALKDNDAGVKREAADALRKLGY